jgi:hypothetical protein
MNHVWTIAIGSNDEESGSHAGLDGEVSCCLSIITCVGSCEAFRQVMGRLTDVASHVT